MAVTGMRAVSAALAKAQRAIEKGVDAAVEETAEAIADGMRSRAPRDTGNLVGKIEVRDGDRDRLVGPVGVPYDAYVEFGTEDTPAQPYAYPAAEAARQQMPKAVADHVKVWL